jgi:hypothetical protein
MNRFSKSQEVIDMSKPYGAHKQQRLLISPEEKARETSTAIVDDLRYGQIVIVAARWMLVLSAFALLLYRSDKINELIFGVLGLLGIAVANFWLHTKILRKQCVEPAWVYLASAADIAVISLMTWFQGGIWGRVFPYYYPAVLCYALIFRSRITMLLTSTVIGAYLVLATASTPAMQAGDDQVLVARLLAIAGVAFVASRYRAVEESRRTRIHNAQRALHQAIEGRETEAI